MMKKITFILMTAILFASCSTEELDSNIESIEVDRVISEGEDPVEMASTELTAGQHIDSGTVTVDATTTGITVNYDTTGDWVILETHLYVGSLEDVPQNNNGSPKIGHFPYNDTHSGDTTNVSYEIGEIAEGTCQFVFAHAVVYNTVTGQEETAWGAGFEVPGNNWAMYFEVCN